MLVYDPSTNPLNNNDWAFPLTEIIHIVGFAFSMGTIAIVDLRLMGLALPRQSAAQLLRDTAPWTLIGIALMLTSGPIIFSSDPNMYLENSMFLYKMAALFMAIAFNYTIHRKVALSDHPSALLAKLTGGISLLLWTSVVFGGLFIAFI